MTTILKNVSREQEIKAFYANTLPVNPLPFLYALVDLVKENGANWIATNQAKALLFTLIQMAYGQNFNLHGVTERQRLRQIIENNK